MPNKILHFYNVTPFLPFPLLYRYDASKGMESLEGYFLSSQCPAKKRWAGRGVWGSAGLFTAIHFNHQLLKQQLPEIQRVCLKFWSSCPASKRSQCFSPYVPCFLFFFSTRCFAKHALGQTHSFAKSSSVLPLPYCFTSRFLAGMALKNRA